MAEVRRVGMAKQVSEWAKKRADVLQNKLGDDLSLAQEFNVLAQALDAAAEEVAKAAYSQIGYSVEGCDWLITDSESMFVKRVLDKLGR